jgi:beta-glucosidase
MRISYIHTILLFGLLSAAPAAMGQHYQYPFQNPKLSDEARMDNVLSLMTIDEKINMFSGVGVERLGIRNPGSVECIHGIVLGGAAWNPKKSQQVTTCYPQGYGLGETWDVNLHHRVAEQIAYEARFLYQNPKYHRSCLILWSPNADMGRDIRWGRTEECYGEDPFLTGEMVTAFVKGFQGPNPRYWTAASLMKHFLANSNENGRGHTSSNFDEALFREYYAYPFGRGIVKGGANALMTAYNKYNGIPCAVNPILRNVLMKEWGFNGIITTDGGGFTQLMKVHKYYDSLDKAAQGCIQAGITRFLDEYKQALKDALNEKLVTEKQLDENIKGNLRVMLRLGLLDSSDKNPYRNIGITDTVAPWTKQETKDLVRLVADKSVVLLKNEDSLLPLDVSKIHKIAVIGNRCDSIYGDWYGGAMPYKITPLKAIKELADAHQIEVRYIRDDKEGAAQDAAAWADVAIVCVGNNPTCGPDWGTSPWGQGVIAGEGREDVDRASIQLEQEDLVKLVRKANPHTVLVLLSSFPYAINWSQEHVPAIIHLTQSCQELGHAITDVLFGRYNPAGRTTQTWVSSIDELPHMLDYNIRHGRTYMYYKGTPLYPFGYGLSYTQFKYANLKLDYTTVAKHKCLTVTADVSNVGAMDGEEVVQLYVTLPGDDAAQRLKGFRRIAVPKGETQKVTIVVPADDLALWNTDKHAFELPVGTVGVKLGASSADIRLKGEVQIK